MAAEELIDLVALLADALEAAWGELASLEEGEWPLPDGIEGQLCERDALVAVMKWLRAELPEPQVESLKARYRDELAKVDRYDVGVAPALLDNVAGTIRDTLEVLRRARIFHPELRE